MVADTLIFEHLRVKGEYHKDQWKNEIRVAAEDYRCTCSMVHHEEFQSDTSLNMVGDHEPITYSWNNVSVYFTPPASSRGLFSRSQTISTEVNILKNVTGVCRPGELLAIMGASGAGKTTLLNVLNHRNTERLRVTGDLFVNGRKVDPNDLTSCSAYVQQDDMFLGCLTVKEQLLFQAQLRMDKFLTYEERENRVDEVILELGLTKCANTKIGVPGRTKSISGGEMKRLNFGCELLTNPLLLFCDEPTSGLDSFMAQNVVGVMKGMAEKGKTVITTIHQPSSEVFQMFDRVLLMAEGRVAFLGEVHDALKFFLRMNIPCPVRCNPSDFFIDQLSVEPGNEADCRHKIEVICNCFQETKNFKAILEGVKSNMEQSQQADGSVNNFQNSGNGKSPYKVSWGSQFGAVLWRAWLEVIREPFLIKVRFFQLMAIAILVGVVYMQQSLDETGVYNINGALFLLLTNMTFQNCTAVINTFCSQKHLFLREHHNGMYRTDVYFLAKNLVEAPLITFYSILYTSIIYFLVGLNPAPERFLFCILVSVLVAQSAVSFGYLVSCIASSVDMALTLTTPLLIPLMLFGGFFLNSRSTPVYLEAFTYLSWFNYGNEALIVNQWTGVANITCMGTRSCYADGNAVVAHMGYTDVNPTVSIINLVCLVVAYRVLAFFFLLLKTRRNKIR